MEENELAITQAIKAPQVGQAEANLSFALKPNSAVKLNRTLQSNSTQISSLKTILSVIYPLFNKINTIEQNGNSSSGTIRKDIETCDR